MLAGRDRRTRAGERRASGSAAAPGRRGRPGGAGSRRGPRRDAVASSSRAPTTTVLRLGVGGEHVERLGAADAEPAPLADGEVVVARCARRARRPARSTIAPGPLAEAAVAGEERALALAGEEAEVLALGLARRPAGRPRRRSRAPRAWSARRAGSAAARATRAAARRACRSGPWPGRRRRASSGPVAVVGEARVVAGRERRGAEPVGERDHRVDPQRRRCRPRTGSASRPAR